MDILASKKGKLWISILNLSGNRLTVSSLQALESAVRGDMLAKLEYLNLKGSLTSDADTNAKWLEILSGHCPILESVHLSNNNLGVPGASALAKLHVSDWLVYLNNTNLGDKGLTILVKNLKDISNPRLADNDIHASGISCLADAVCSGGLKIDGELDLSGNPLGLEGTIAIGRMLSGSHYGLHYLNLSRCDLTTAGGGLPNADFISCEAVGRQLCQMPQTSTIGGLNLDHNSFTGDGIHILAGFMHLCPGLWHLSTRDCGITSDDLIWLLGRLKSLSPGLYSELISWNLWGNQIDDRGVSALIDHLPLLPHLWYGGDTMYSLSDNPVERNIEMMERLKKELARRREIEEELERPRQERGEEHRQKIESQLVLEEPIRPLGREHEEKVHKLKR